MYAIKSVSEEGTYFLVKGWNKRKKFWTKTASLEENGFGTPGAAMRSFDCLLKVMPDYRTDKISIVRFDIENRKLVTVSNWVILKPFWEAKSYGQN